MARTFNISVITPERALLETDATFAAVPAHDGEVGILPGRAALLAKLGVGWLRITTADDGEHRFLVDGGFVQVSDDKVSVLTDRAQTPEEIDTAGAAEALAEAQALPIPDDTAFETRQRALARARAQAKSG